ncbi:uncharacterized protein LOC122401201 [Colletes gigas]|uniref:uncharacterized protein LOC122401201 n=1 Tax=Colletes gigas TaxID=935657 RepID=UPI001C9B4B2D|nr:uncharacterized protein LOC122401201 [Colletes gigas]
MPSVRLLSFVLACLDFLMICATQSPIDAPRTLSRPKRYLIFPEGSNVQLVFCLTIGTYATENDVVMGMTVALAWELPSKVDDKISKLLDRKSRSIVFPKIEALLQSTGLDGRACVMRALCEAGQRDPADLGKGTLVQELLHAIFTLPKDGRFERSEDRGYEHAHRTTENCSQLYPTCQHSIYEVDF